MNIAVDAVAILRRAKLVLATEASAIAAMETRVGQAMVNAVHTILASRGRVVVTGIGKSGHVGRKLAATLASTGTPAFFVHPAEASHGDMGMIAADDVVIALSNSGEVAEVNALLTPIKRVGAKIISITGNEQPTLATESDIALDARDAEEACPLGLAYTASTVTAIPTTASGASVEVSVTFQAPLLPADAISRWKMVDASGALSFPKHAGVWCAVSVVSI